MKALDVGFDRDANHIIWDGLWALCPFLVRAVMYFVCANLVRSGCILLSGLLWGLACAKHGLNGNG